MTARLVVFRSLLTCWFFICSYRGGLSSYGLALMVVRFLQPYYPNLLNGADTKQSWVQAFMQDLNKVNREAIKIDEDSVKQM